METKVEALQDNKVKVTVTVDAKEVDNRIKKAYKDFGKKYKFPGFRPGHVPRQIIDANLGKEAVLSTVTDEMLNETFPVAIDEADLILISEPKFSEVDGLVEEGKDFTFSIECEVKPALELSGYDNVEIEMPSAEVTEDEVNAEIDAMLTHYSEYSNAAANKKFADGNMAEMKITATDDKGENIESITADNRQYAMGSGLFPQSFDEELKGMKKGETKQFTIDVPEEPTVMTSSLIGKTEKINFEVEILQLKVRKTPELTDEFAKEKLGMDSAAEVREELTTLLTNQKNSFIPRLKEERALTALAERLQGEAPAALVEQQESALLQNFFGQLQQQGITFDVYLQSQGLSSQQFRDDVKKQAADLTKQDLALDAWAAHAGLEATDDDIMIEFQKSGAQDPAALKKEWEESGQLFLVRQGILRQKAAVDVTDNAVVTEEKPKEEKAKKAKKASKKAAEDKAE